ncbi:hotdog domain-containing protein [Nocardioides sp. CCNWLW239]|uniref:thioesterase family protein n=1 Tax=Nocardioides sp. CCNWLW239 TaxID=3128902 RepID=UPI0030181DF1
MAHEHPQQDGFDLGQAQVLEFTVTEADTALVQGSGDLEVLGTPRLIAWMEAATCAVAAAVLDPGRTSVGVRVAVDHKAPSPVGARIVATAVVTEVESSLVTFSVVGVDAATGEVVGSGAITRAVVDRSRFLARLQRRSTA